MSSVSYCVESAGCLVLNDGCLAVVSWSLSEVYIYERIYINTYIYMYIYNGLFDTHSHCHGSVVVDSPLSFPVQTGGLPPDRKIPGLQYTTTSSNLVRHVLSGSLYSTSRAVFCV